MAEKRASKVSREAKPKPMGESPSNASPGDNEAASNDEAPQVEETKEAAQAKASATADVAKQKFQAAPEAASQATDRTIAALRENPVPALAAVGALLVVAAVVRRRRR